MGIRTENYLVYPLSWGGCFEAAALFLTPKINVLIRVEKAYFFFLYCLLERGGNDLLSRVLKWPRNSFFLRKQHFFKPTKICHLRDAPSHQTGQPHVDAPNTACPDTENPDTDNPCLENRPQLNKDKRNPD